MSPRPESIFQIRCDAAKGRYFLSMDGDDDMEAFCSLSRAIGHVKQQIDRPTQVSVRTSRRAEIMRVTVLPKERLYRESRAAV